MKISKVKDFYIDWVKGGFRLGTKFTDWLMEKVEASPKTGRIAGGTIDVLAGGWIAYTAATSLIGTAIGVTAAVATAAFTLAPAAIGGAAVACAVGVVVTALNCVWGGLGLGLLDAARKKVGLPPIPSLFKNVRSSAPKSVEFLKKPFKTGVKPSSSFKKVADSTVTVSSKPAPTAGKDFKI